MPDELKKSQQRAIQYWYVDGTFEFFFGLLCMAIGAYMYVENLLQGTWFATPVNVLLVVVVIGGSFLMRWLVQKWKERITFPRTGYVTYSRKENRGQTILMGVIVLGVLGLTVLFLSYVDLQFSAWPLVTGILFSIVMIFVGWRTSLHRFYLHALLSVLTAVGLAFSPWDNHVGLAAFYLVIGLILITSGMLLLRKYLRQNPALREEDDEG